MNVFKLITIAALLLVLSGVPGTAAGSEEDQDALELLRGDLAFLMWEYQGTVVYLGRDGSRHPVAGARFHSGDFEDGRPVGKLTKSGKTDKLGRFSKLAGTMIPLESVCDDRSLWRVHVMLKAKGCEDVVLEVTPDWEPREVEMSCPGLPRTKSRR